jgi:cytochrome P450
MSTIGHLIAFRRDRLNFLERQASARGVVDLHLGPPTYLLTEPDDIAHVLVANSGNYSKTRRLTSRQGRSRSGRGLLTSTGLAHLRLRRTLAPNFRRRAVERFAWLAVDEVEELCARWRAGEKVEVSSPLMRLAQRTILRSLFSTATPAQLDTLAATIDVRRAHLRQLFASLASVAEFIPAAAGGRYRRAMSNFDRIVYSEIAARRADDAPPDDLLSTLMRASSDDCPGLTDPQLRDEVLTLTLTGFETVGEALAWSVDLFARNPDTAAGIRDEVRSVLDGRPAEPRDLESMPLLVMAISESLRLYPPTWLIVRVANSQDSLPSGASIPARAKLYVSPWVVHRHPELWRDPLRFDPERFGAWRRSDRHRYAYLPFGAGPRVCMGEALARMELTLVLATICRRWRLEAVGPPPIPEPGLTLSPRGGVRVRLADAG